MTSTVGRTGIAPRDNGAPPPHIPLVDIDLGTIEFWEWDDDRRDGAFATLRREAPVTFFETPELAGFPSHGRRRTERRATSPSSPARP
jgi:hypothetical protein